MSFCSQMNPVKCHIIWTYLTLPFCNFPCFISIFTPVKSGSVLTYWKSNLLCLLSGMLALKVLQYANATPLVVKRSCVSLCNVPVGGVDDEYDQIFVLIKGFLNHLHLKTISED